jgi:hypothetical protein
MWCGSFQVNTEDYEPDLSDDDKELHHNFSDGCLTAGDDLTHAGVNYSLRARRGVVLDTPEGIVGVGYGLGESGGGAKSSKNGGGAGGGSPLGGSKALKLLGIQERSDAAMDRFNSATPLGPLDVIDGASAKAPIFLFTQPVSCRVVCGVCRVVSCALTIRLLRPWQAAKKSLRPGAARRSSCRAGLRPTRSRSAAGPRIRPNSRNRAPSLQPPPRPA